jgi:hypothetical protein
MRSASRVVLVSCLVAACGDGGGRGPDFADDHPRIYLPHNRDRLVAALEAGGPAATRFVALVDEIVGGGETYSFFAWNAALVGQLTGEARYCAYAVAKVDAWVSSEEALIAAGSRPVVAGDSYLRVGDHIGDLALTYDWCFDAVGAERARRWLAYAQRAVDNLWDPGNATWGGRSEPWNGWSTDNPHNNYFYSFNRATMLLGLATRGELPEADGWIARFRDVHLDRMIVPTFDLELVGGGSREGTGYGVAMRNLWELYDLWEGSTGERIADLTPHTRASLVELLHTVLPTRDRIAPIGDHTRDASAVLYDYQRLYGLLLMRFFPGDPATAELRYQLARSSVPRMSSKFNYAYDFLYDDGAIEEAAPALATAYHARGTGHVFARSSWGDDATWFHATGGPFVESHDHQDESGFLLYKGGWLAYDPNVDSRSGDRASTEYHNLVRFEQGGATVPMHLYTEAELVAVHRGAGYLHTAVDVLPIYEGEESVVRHQRELVYLEPDLLVVFDRVDGGGATPVWQLNSPLVPVVAGARTTLSGEAASLVVDRVIPATASSAVIDWPSVDSNLRGGHRLDVRGDGGLFLHVLGVDGAASQVTRSDGGDQVGVSISHAGGTAIVRFSPTGFGATVDLGAGPIALGPGIDPIPER